MTAAQPDDAPLSTWLSQALIAFTIEFDNTFEARMPHRTAVGPSRSGRGPWLVSQAMWVNFMRHLPPEGARLGDLKLAAELTNLAGLLRWGYVSADPKPTGPKPTKADTVIRPTRAGRQAQQIWALLGAEIEDRWRERHGAAAIG